MEPEKPKFSWKRLIITITAILITAGITGGGVWYYLSRQMAQIEDAKNKEIEALQARVDAEKKPTATTTKDETADWKTFTNSVFSIKYPSNWVFKDFSVLDQGANLVGFAETAAKIAPEQSDGYSTIDVAWGPNALTNLTNSPEKLTTENITTASGLTGKKHTLAAGRPNDMTGENKEVIYEFKLANGKVLTLRNINDNQKSVFEKMVQTVK